MAPYLSLQFRMLKFSVWSQILVWVPVFVDNLHRVFAGTSAYLIQQMLSTFTRDNAVLMFIGVVKASLGI